MSSGRRACRLVVAPDPSPPITGQAFLALGDPVARGLDGREPRVVSLFIRALVASMSSPTLLKKANTVSSNSARRSGGIEQRSLPWTRS